MLDYPKPLTSIQKFNWFFLWFVCRGSLSVGLFNLAEIKMFQSSEPYVSGGLKEWALPFTLMLDLLTEITLIICGFFTVGLVIIALGVFGLRRFFEILFGSPFRKSNFR